MPRLPKSAAGGTPPVEELMRPPREEAAADGPPRKADEKIDLRTGEKRAVDQSAVVAIDPGDVHCGMALGIVSTSGQFQCVRAWEATPDECADEVAGWLLAGELQAVVVERFSLYADKAATQTGSTMPTAELVGVLKYLVRVAGGALLAVQGADIKKSMRAQLKARGVALLPAEADHARDAQLHLWHWAGRNLLGWGA